MSQTKAELVNGLSVNAALADAITVDSSGNLGVNTTSPSGASGKVLEINGGSGQARFVLKNNTTGSASTDGHQIFSDGTTLGIQNREAGSTTFETNGSEHMRIDSSGRVGIGSTSPTEKLEINLGTDKIVQFTGGIGQIGNVAGVFAVNTAKSEIADFGIMGNTLKFASGTAIGGAERMRINSNGKVQIGTTSAIQSSLLSLVSGDGVRVAALQSGGTGANDAILFRNANGDVGNIRTSGSSTAFNTSSDYRLKENVVSISDGITRLKTLKPSRFNFKADTDTTVDGFLAHEVTAVPEAITGTKDEVVTQTMIDAGKYEEGTLNDPIYQGIDQSKLVPLLTAALQEEIAKREALEARVATLEAA